MASRVRDLWFTTGKRGPRRKTPRHPDMGGNPAASRWLSVWMIGGREHTKAFSTKAAAQAFGSRMHTDAERGEYLDPKAGRAVVGGFGAKWLKLLEVGPTSRVRYERCWRLHVKPKFGGQAVGAVQASDVAAWSRSLAAHPVTRQLALMVLAGVFDLAVADGVRKDNPARSSVVARPRVKRPAREAWDVARIHAVAAACRGYESVPLIAAALGLRIGEVCGLGAGDVEDGVVNVVRQVVFTGGEWTFKLPKGGKARTVPLCRGAAALLGQLPAPEVVTLPWLAEDGSHGKPRRVPLLVRGIEGGQMKPKSWDQCVWHPALAATGVPRDRQNGMHALRHWYSTTLLDAGVSLAGVMEFLGHSRGSVPLAVGVYGHTTAATLEAARNAVDRTLFRLRPVPSDGTVSELRDAR